MNPRPLAALIVLTLCTVTVSADDSPVTRLYQFLQAETYEASFTQRVYDEKSVLIDDSKGRFSVSRPGRFRWEYISPSRQMLVSDGVNLINYDPELEQATVQPLTVSMGYAPIMLLLEKNPSLNDFEITAQRREDGLEWISLEPKVKDMEFTRIEIGMTQETVVKMLMQDHFEQNTVIEFLNGKFDHQLTEDTFKVYLPRGTDVVGDYLLAP